MPIQSNSPPLSQEVYQTGWRKLHWPADKFFMAWNYAKYVNKVVEQGKAEYSIPMYVNAWLQQPNMAWPGTYPSGGPLPQVHDIWRAGAPAVDILAPDLYLQYFDEVAQRFTRNGNPFFVPETSANAANAFLAVGKYNAIGFSPFGIERSVGPDNELAAAHHVISEMAPAILAQQGKDAIATVLMNQGDAPMKVKLGDYTLSLSYIGRDRVPIAPEPATPAARQQAPQAGRAQAQAGGRGGQAAQQGSTQTSAILVASGPDEFFMCAGSGGLRVAFTPNLPGPATVGLGDVQGGKFVDGKWVVVRQLGGDDTGQCEILTLRANTATRVTVYRNE